ncbi:putative 2OG-Fe(II) oxygenase [Ferrovibrio sp.]|uniref:putative 2OG-Fe(II) oxygenase n=1 Tax=Ferrovibrio sp. TaxID=1917215 RepID=UPI001B4D7D1F|nr:putative 2OG-Fe(II) oxygenase [Ferrovibrio sp.]MBP7062923.1 hypothetical protein [Ferrovibrio sp.]
MSAVPGPELIPLARQAAFLLLQGHAAAAAEHCRRLQAVDANMDWFGGFTDMLAWALPRPRLYPLVRALVDAGFANARSFDLLAAAAIWAGNSQAARALTDPERFLHITALHGPDDPVLPLLAAELSRDLEHFQQPSSRAIRMGWRRNHLEQDESPLLRQMFQRLQAMALDYIARLPDDPDNAFLRARPARLGLRGWSVVSGAETHHVSHLHSKSWINGVYYVAVPAVVADAVEKPGWLRVGPAVERGFNAENGWDERWIQPQPGLVVLMPSHFTHETRPLNQADERRICVAFELYDQAAGPVQLL